MSLFLIGYRGTGKTTVGALAAERLGWRFVDADALLQQRAGRSIAEIFAAGGEPAFRELEQQIVAELAQRQDHVIALGGGAVLRQANRDALAAADGVVVWLTASADCLAQRLAQDAATAAQRPALTGQSPEAEIATLLGEREPLYRQCAAWAVDTQGRSPAEIAADILKRLAASGDAGPDG